MLELVIFDPARSETNKSSEQTENAGNQSKQSHVQPAGTLPPCKHRVYPRACRLTTCRLSVSSSTELVAVFDHSDLFHRGHQLREDHTFIPTTHRRLTWTLIRDMTLRSKVTRRPRTPPQRLTSWESFAAKTRRYILLRPQAQPEPDAAGRWRSRMYVAGTH